MKEFKIYVKHHPGELAKVTEVLANRAVNIKAISSEAFGGEATLRIVTNDVTTTKNALDEAGAKYDLNDLLTLSLIDRPGELSKIAKKLGRAKINIQSIYILGQKGGKTEVALVVDDMEKAKDRLSH